jgi:outer membrane protein OmpA-like peptidoglycan-associated protein
VLALVAPSGAARAEPRLISLEGQGAIALSTPQSDLFGPGANVALGLRYPLHALLQVGAEVRAGMLSAGSEPLELGRADLGPGSFELGMLMLRVKPLATVDGSGPRRAAGLFADFGAGGGVTGKRGRVGFQGGLGYGVSLGGGFTLAPTVRYLQVLQPTDALSSADARLLLFGLELSAFDAQPRVHGVVKLAAAKPAPAPVVPKSQLRAAVAPAPDLDSDGDGIADSKDGCPAEAEDEDSFEDADGCPDPDNDRDHIADVNDKCPNEAEVVNGNEDADGCPDEGLIVLEDNRIVLDESVLFDAGFARIKHAARPILAAIVKLKTQHPEWTKLRVEGHADATGPDDVNQVLSERRAKNAMKWLIDLGFPVDQLESHGYGATRPRSKGRGEDARKRNRRVEFVVVTAEPAANGGEAK